MKTITINFNEALLSVPPDKTFGWGLTITMYDNVVKTDFSENIFDLITTALNFIDFVEYNEDNKFDFNVNLSVHEENIAEEIIYYNILYFIYKRFCKNSLYYKDNLNKSKFSTKTKISYDYIRKEIIYYTENNKDYFLTFPNTDVCNYFTERFESLILKCSNMI